MAKDSLGTILGLSALGEVAVLNTKVDEAIAAGFKPEIVETLPTHDISNKTLYLVPNGDSGDDTYTEYLYVDNKWEIVGTTAVDLSNYLAKDNATAFTPNGDYNPATKKYVDDKQTTFVWSTGINWNFLELNTGGKISPKYPISEAPGMTLKEFLIMTYNHGKTTGTPTEVILNIQYESLAGSISSNDAGVGGYCYFKGGLRTLRIEYRLQNGLATDIITLTKTTDSYVTTNTAQTISAKKTFSTLPESSVTPTTANQLTNKSYVDSLVPEELTQYDIEDILYGSYDIEMGYNVTYGIIVLNSGITFNPEYFTSTQQSGYIVYTPTKGVILEMQGVASALNKIYIRVSDEETLLAFLPDGEIGEVVAAWEAEHGSLLGIPTRIYIAPGATHVGNQPNNEFDVSFNYGDPVEENNGGGE